MDGSCETKNIEIVRNSQKFIYGSQHLDGTQQLGCNRTGPMNRSHEPTQQIISIQVSIIHFHTISVANRDNQRSKKTYTVCMGPKIGLMEHESSPMQPRSHRNTVCSIGPIGTSLQVDRNDIAYRFRKRKTCMPDEDSD